MADVDEISELVRAQADLPLPPSRVFDLTSAMAAGARARSRRRLTSVIAAAAATLVVAAGGITLVNGRPTGTAEPAGPASPTTTTVSPRTDRFDVLRQQLAPGWLPAGTAMRMTGVHPWKYWLKASYPTDVVRPAGGRIWIEVFAALPGPSGGEKDRDAMMMGLADGAAPPGNLGPDVNGTSSTWVTRTDDQVSLAWHWAPGAWAVVTAMAGTATGSSSDALRDTVEHVASTLTTNNDQQVRLPFTMDQPPADLSPSASLEARSSDGWYESQLTLARPGSPPDPSGGPRGADITVVTDNTTGSQATGYANTTLDGHPALVSFETGSFGRVDLFQVNGHRVTVNAYDTAAVDQATATAMALSVRLVSNPADRASWTGSPIR